MFPLVLPEAGPLVRRLCDDTCTDSARKLCQERNDVHKEVTPCFAFSSFHLKPVGNNSQLMQQSPLEDAIVGEHVLTIL